MSLESFDTDRGWRSNCQEEDERYHVRVGDDGVTGLSTVNRKKSPITLIVAFFAAMGALATGLGVHGRWLAAKVHEFSAALRTLPALAMCSAAEMDALAPSLTLIVNENLYRLTATAYTYVESRLKGLRTYGLNPWDNQVFDLYSKMNAGLVQLHLVYGRMCSMGRAPAPARVSGSKTKRQDHDAVHGLKDSKGVPICVNFHRGKCNAKVCPHGRSHEPLTKAQDEMYELNFVQRRGGRSRRRDAEQSGRDD